MDQRRRGLFIMIFSLIGATGVLLGTVDAVGDASSWELLAYVVVLLGALFAAVVGYRLWKRPTVEH